MLSKWTCLLMLLVFTAVSVVSQLYVLLPVAEELANNFHQPVSKVILLTSFFGFAYAAGFLVWGPLSDRYSRKHIMLAGMSGLLIFTVLLSFTLPFYWVLLLRIAQGFMAASFPPLALALIAERFPNTKKMNAIAWMSTAFLLSALIGPWIGNAVIDGTLTRVMPIFIICYVFSLIGFIWLPDSSTTTARSKIPAFLPRLRAILAMPELLKVYLVALVLLGSFVALYTTISLYYSSALQTQGWDIAKLRIVAVPCMFMPLIIGRVLGKLGVPVSIFLFLIIAATMLALQVFSLGNQFFVVYHLLFVAAIASAVPSLIALVNQLSPPENRGLAVSLYTFSLFIGASLGAWLPVLLGEQFILYLAGALFLVGLLYLPFFNRQVKEKKHA
ncbi:MFS transporter [Moritella yayanosii]|uniref:Putative Arabinose efflux permease family protein n=1 Tax=Moritella yayanosii TaxID=69539 RepID=A0A330LNI5_9GAMM|nr:MFS transporter [Moritella yayanosii]SQD78430.1 putative Arabinose efflux permease family protein [Moritella yayanosii]